MTLTPSDIEQKTFSTALRGYNLDEVDDFLDEVVRSMRKLHEDLETARSEVEAKGAEPDDLGKPAAAAPPVSAPIVETPPPPPPPPPVAPIDESAVGKAMIAAQETAERIINDARSEADEIVVKARSEAETFEESRLQRKANAEQEITRIDGLVNRVKSELADLSVAVGAELEEMSGAIDVAITDLDGSLGATADSEEDLAADEPDDHEGQNIVGVGSEPLEAAVGEADAPSSGRRRHRSESEETDVTYDSGPDDEFEDDSGDDSEDDSGDDLEDDYFNFPEGDDDEESDGSDSRT